MFKIVVQSVLNNVPFGLREEALMMGNITHHFSHILTFLTTFIIKFGYNALIDWRCNCCRCSAGAAGHCGCRAQCSHCLHKARKVLREVLRGKLLWDWAIAHMTAKQAAARGLAQLWSSRRDRTSVQGTEKNGCKHTFMH